MRILRLLSGALLAAAACAAPQPPPSAGPAPKEPIPEGPLAAVRRLYAEGEFVAARQRARTMAGDPEARRIAARIEALAGVRGKPTEMEIRQKIALYEVLSHLSEGERLHQEGRHADAVTHLERGLAEIPRYSLERRFPRALRSRVLGILEQARAGARR